MQQMPTPPTLVLLPGMDGTGMLFEPLLRALPPDLPVKVLRYPGQDALSYEALESFVRAALPPYAPLVLLGESFSGPLAASLARRLGERVRGLILCCTFVDNPRPALAALQPLLKLVPPQAVRTRLAARLLFGPYATPALRTALRHALDQVAPAVLRARLQAILAMDASAALAAVTAPVLYLQASQDTLVPPRAAQRALQACPAMQVIRLQGPHCLLQAAPVETAAVVAAFVRASASAG